MSSNPTLPAARRLHSKTLGWEMLIEEWQFHQEDIP